MELLFTNLYFLAMTVGSFLSVLLFFLGIKKLTQHAKNPHDPKNSLGGALVIMIGASLLFSLNTSVSLFTATLTNNQGHCFVVYEKGEKVDEINPNGGKCYNENGSELTPELKEKLEKSKGKSLEIMQKRIRIMFLCFQAIGLIYFIKAIFLLKSAAEGSTSMTYGKILTMLIFSSLVIDMPNTLEMIINTVKQATAT